MFISSPKHLIVLKLKNIKDDPSESCSASFIKLLARFSAFIHVDSYNFDGEIYITWHFNPNSLAAKSADAWGS